MPEQTSSRPSGRTAGIACSERCARVGRGSTCRRRWCVDKLHCHVCASPALDVSALSLAAVTARRVLGPQRYWKRTLAPRSARAIPCANVLFSRLQLGLSAPADCQVYRLMDSDDLQQHRTQEGPADAQTLQTCADARMRCFHMHMRFDMAVACVSGRRGLRV